jgi:hypothetical protein
MTRNTAEDPGFGPLTWQRKTQLRREDRLQDNIKIESVNVEFVHLVERIVRWWPHLNGVM